jgi:hypothetical protein
MSVLKKMRSEIDTADRLRIAIAAISARYSHKMICAAPEVVQRRVRDLNRMPIGTLEAVEAWERGWLQVLDRLKGSGYERKTEN